MNAIIILSLLNALVLVPLMMGSALYARKQKEESAGALLLRVTRPRLRTWTVALLVVWFILISSLMIDSVRWDVSPRENPALTPLASFWVATVAFILRGPFQWTIEFREGGVLTLNLFPWEKVKHATIVGNDVGINVSGYGRVSFRIASRDAAAVREFLEARLAPGELGMQANDESRVM